MLRHLFAIACAVFIGLNAFNIQIPGLSTLSGTSVIWLAVLPFAVVVLAGLLRGEA